MAQAGDGPDQDADAGTLKPHDCRVVGGSHDWDVNKVATVGTEQTYLWKCKNCPKEMMVDV